MMADYKYKSLAQLKAAYDSGELAREDFLMLDNDCTTVYRDRGDDGAQEQVFDGGFPSRLLEEALTMLGIPWENA